MSRSRPAAAPGDEFPRRASILTVPFPPLRARASARAVNGTNRHRRPGLFPSSRGLPVGLPGPHRRPRIHPTDRPGPLHRRLHGEPALERLPRDPGPRLRPAVRAGLPARPRRGQAGRDLPPEARRRRSPRGRRARCCRRSRRSRTASASPASAPVCASLTVANDLLPLGYEVTIFEQYGEPGGLMRTNIPSFRLPQTVLDEEIGHDHRHGRRPAPELPGEEPARAARAGRLRRRVRRLGRAQGQGAEAARARHECRSHPHRHHLARVGGLRPHRHDRRARADHRRRQHRDGLLPHDRCASAPRPSR